MSIWTNANQENLNSSHLTIPFSSPPAITLMDTPSGWLEKATEQMISLQWTCPTRSPFTVQSLRSLPPPAEMPKPPAGHRLWASQSPAPWVPEGIAGAKLISVVKCVGNSWLKTVQRKLLHCRSHGTLHIYLETMTSEENKKLICNREQQGKLIMNLSISAYELPNLKVPRTLKNLQNEKKIVSEIIYKWLMWLLKKKKITVKVSWVKNEFFKKKKKGNLILQNGIESINQCFTELIIFFSKTLSNQTFCGFPGG